MQNIKLFDTMKQSIHLRVRSLSKMEELPNYKMTTSAQTFIAIFYTCITLFTVYTHVYANAPQPIPQHAGFIYHLPRNNCCRDKIKPLHRANRLFANNNAVVWVGSIYNFIWMCENTIGIRYCLIISGWTAGCQINSDTYTVEEWQEWQWCLKLNL